MHSVKGWSTRPELTGVKTSKRGSGRKLGFEKKSLGFWKPRVLGFCLHAAICKLATGTNRRVVVALTGVASTSSEASSIMPKSKRNKLGKILSMDELSGIFLWGIWC